MLSSLEQLTSLRILVVGDIFLDTYTEGSIARISPEAPVAIVNAQRESIRPGGAGNVALNFLALGNQVALLSRIGDDEAGRQLRALLTEINTDGLFIERDFMTGQKQRILVERQQLMRIDRERVIALDHRVERELLDLAENLLASVDIVAISDYGKGLCTQSFTQQLIKRARAFNRQVIVDPKGSDFTRYSGATLIKPNLAEFCAAAKVQKAVCLPTTARDVLSDCPEVDWLLVTQSEKGMTLCSAKGQSFEISAHPVLINDVTGAGDTALAVLTHSWGCGLSPKRSAELANQAAGIAVQHLGCAQITRSQIAESIAQAQSHRSAPDQISPKTLKSLLLGKSALLIAIEKEGLTLQGLVLLLKILQDHLASLKNCKVVLFCKKEIIDQNTLRLIESLKEIDFIFTKSQDLYLVVSATEWRSIFCWDGEEFSKGNHWLEQMREQAI